MNLINSGMLIYIILAILIVVLIISIIKKAVKLVIFLILLLLGISAYNIVVKGSTPMEEFRGYKTNIKYTKDVAEYSVKTKNSVNNIKKAMESKTIDDATINIILTENENIHKYEAEVKVLEHTKRLDGIHNKYCEYLRSIADSSQGAANLAKSSKGKNISILQVWVDKLSSNINEMLKIQPK